MKSAHPIEDWGNSFRTKERIIKLTFVDRELKDAGYKVGDLISGVSIAKDGGAWFKDQTAYRYELISRKEEWKYL